MNLKFLICSLLALGSQLFAEGEGWFSVEPRKKAQEQVDEKDASIWVLFSKNLGMEKILVRFPEEPTYHYTPDGSLRIISERGPESYELFIQKTEGGEGDRGDLIYPSEGMWVREHFIQTASHLYRFKTVSFTADESAQREFISSFSIEKNS